MVTRDEIRFEPDPSSAMNDDDWGIAISDYTDECTTAHYVRAHFPPGQVVEIEKLLRERGAPLSATPWRPTSPVPPPRPSVLADRGGLEQLARSIASAFGEVLPDGPWIESELIPYTERQDSSCRRVGDLVITLSLRRSYCDSSAGPRLLGTSASITLEVRGRSLTCELPSSRAVGDAELDAHLREAGVVPS